MIKKLDESWFEQIYPIMEEAFPYSERRTKEAQQLLFQKPEYEMYGWFVEGELSAFLAAWDLGSIRFGEHLATNRKKRNAGVGKQLFQAYEALSEKPLVFEVELPDDELASRRIGFYERMGYHLYKDVEYYQGPFHEETQALPLRLMMNRKDCSEAELNEIIDLIYARVYGIKRWF